MSRASTFARVYHSAERCAFVSALSCFGCGRSPCENAHVGGRGGMGRKSDYRFIVPLCAACHRELHGTGERTFERKRNLNLGVCAELVQRSWLAHQARAVGFLPIGTMSPTEQG